MLYRVALAGLLIAVSSDVPNGQRIRRADDKAPPSIRIVAPSPGQRVESFTPPIEIEYDDEGSGVSVVTFRAMVNDRDYSADFEHHSRGASAAISSTHHLPLGENRLVVQVADRLGNVGRAESTFVNAGGGWLTVVADPGVGPRRHVELVLDASGSMNDKLLDNTRIAVAKGAVKSLVQAVPDRTPMGLRVFKGCDNIKAELPIARIDKTRFTATVDAIQPNGGTPIVASLLQSFGALAKIQDAERVSVLVTDGGESCNGAIADAVSAAKEQSVRVIVISFDIKEATVNRQLRELAQLTGGAYFDAQDGAELQAALEKSVLRLGYGIYDAKGTRLAEGEVNAGRVMLPNGAYEVRFDTASAKVRQAVEITPLGEVTVRLRQAGAGIAAEVASK